MDCLSSANWCHRGDVQDHDHPISFSEHSCCDQWAITALLSDQHYQPELPDGDSMGGADFGFRAQCKSTFQSVPDNLNLAVSVTLNLIEICHASVDKIGRPLDICSPSHRAASIFRRCKYSNWEYDCKPTIFLRVSQSEIPGDYSNIQSAPIRR
jgi:hypothetical protein